MDIFNLNLAIVLTSTDHQPGERWIEVQPQHVLYP
jgi:hypothetical protein